MIKRWYVWYELGWLCEVRNEDWWVMWVVVCSEVVDVGG